jgi:serine/threonine protein kinase
VAGAEAIPAELRDLLGNTIADGYRLDDIIGSGGMGVVFAAEQLKLRRPVAIKILDPAVADPARERRFKREAESVARLDHVNCLQVFDFGTTPEGLHYMVMPQLQGHTLSRLLREENLPPRRAMQLVIQILAGLEHAHGQGLIHRDLKPANIFLVAGDDAGDEIVKIVDFGIAKIIDDDADSSFQTRAGVMFGTPAYMSPEQAVGEPVDARSDLYALGIVLYRMIAGTVPHRGKTVIDQMRKRATLDIPALPSPVPPEVSDFMQWLCTRDAHERCPSASKARREAQSLLAAAPATSAGWDDPLPDLAVMTPGDQTVLEDRSVSVTRLDALIQDGSGASSIRFPNSTPSPTPERAELVNPTQTLIDPDHEDEVAPAPEASVGPSRTVSVDPSPVEDSAAAGDAETRPEAEIPEPLADSKPDSKPAEPTGSVTVGSDRRWWWLAAVGAVAVVAVAVWPEAAPEPEAAAATEAPLAPDPAPPPEAEANAGAETGGETGEPIGDESPPPPPEVEEPDLLEKLTRVNTRDPDAILGFAERHALLDELRDDPRAATLIDEPANAVWDLGQAKDAEAPCSAFLAGLDRIEHSTDRWVRRAIRRAQVPEGSEPACRTARRRLDQLRGSGKASATGSPTPDRTPTETETKPKAGEVTPKLGGLK